jgi:hypothetical protein
VIDGGWLSLTLTVNVQVAVLPEESGVVQVTVVVPFGKKDPDAGEQTGGPAPGQLSLIVGAGYVTTAPHWFGSLDTDLLAGQVIVGGCVSFTVTVKEQLGPAVDVQVTVVVPLGKNEPDAGEQLTVPQVPVVVGAG